MKFLLSLLFAVLVFNPTMVRAAECSPDGAFMRLGANLVPQTGLTSKIWDSEAGLEVTTPVATLQYAFERIKPLVHEVELQSLSHEANTYKLKLVARQWFVWDTLQLKLDFPAGDRMRLRVIDNWIPSDLILFKLETGLLRATEKVPMRITRREGALELQIVSGELSFDRIRIKLVNPVMSAQNWE